MPWIILEVWREPNLEPGYSDTDILYDALDAGHIPERSDVSLADLKEFYRGSTPDLTKAAAWSHLIFGSYTQTEIRRAIRSDTWQKLRNSMLGTTLQYKFNALTNYLHIPMNEDDDFRRKIQITNYVNALKRGGLIK